MRTKLKGLIREEAGAALVLTLVLLVVGGLILAPLMGHVGTGHLAGQVHEKRMDELYAADAGVEDAIWRIVSNDSGLPHDPCRDKPWSHNYTIDGIDDSGINGKKVEVRVDYLTEERYMVTSVANPNGTSSTTVQALIQAEVFDLFAGALVSSGDITFHKDCKVTGDVYYVGSITGDYERDREPLKISADVFPTKEADYAIAEEFKSQAQLGSTHHGSLDIDANGDLGPLYITGDLDITEQNIVVNLTGTIYVEGEIRASKEYTIRGSGSIVAVGDIYLSKLADYGIDGDTVIMSLEGDITFKKEADIEAFVYAPTGKIEFDKDATVIGSVVGSEIDIKKDNVFDYVAKASTFGFLSVLVPYAAHITAYTIA